MPVEVLHPGLLTTVQDGGRHGLYSLGVPPSGAMDDFSFRVANLLVGNDEGVAALETTYMGPKLAFGEDRVVAVTGADMRPRVDGDERPAWEAFLVTAGHAVSVDRHRARARRHLALAGRLAVRTGLRR